MFEALWDMSEADMSYICGAYTVSSLPQAAVVVGGGVRAVISSVAAVLRVEFDCKCCAARLNIRTVIDCTTALLSKLSTAQSYMLSRMQRTKYRNTLEHQHLALPQFIWFVDCTLLRATTTTTRVSAECNRATVDKTERESDERHSNTQNAMLVQLLSKQRAKLSSVIKRLILHQIKVY
eukprot:9604-Heterococcus_DN1.PRE.10